MSAANHCDLLLLNLSTLNTSSEEYTMQPQRYYNNLMITIVVLLQVLSQNSLVDLLLWYFQLCGHPTSLTEPPDTNDPIIRASRKQSTREWEQKAMYYTTTEPHNSP